MGKLGNLVYEDLVARGKDIKTARKWCNWTVRFEKCCGEKEEYGRADVIKFLAMLRNEGHKQNSINTMIRPIKLLAQVQGWPFPRMAIAKVREDEINRPVLTRDEVCEMIRRGKRVLNGRELACLAFATTYGLRREEMTDLKISDGKVTVNTVKGGRVTTHIIPGVIKYYIVGYKKSDVSYMSLIFQRIVRKLGMKLNGREYGWHAIRRALVTELVVRDVSLLNILRFMRWSEASVRGEFSMIAVYARRSQEDIDFEIFKAHPFLQVWAEE